MILDQLRLFIQNHPFEFNGNTGKVLKKAEELAAASCKGLGKGQFLFEEHVEELIPDAALRERFLKSLTTLPYVELECRFALTLGSAGS
ncbi:MAG: hypothetical protein WC761_05075 [Candidatus Paceibacterota bacterium]|jgi:hypothetical protein